jgi:hypothetical protein
VGGYHAEKDMVLILDVARFKYPPHWVSLPLLWQALGLLDASTGLSRGFALLRVSPVHTPVLFKMDRRRQLRQRWRQMQRSMLDALTAALAQRPCSCSCQGGACTEAAAAAATATAAAATAAGNVPLCYCCSC